MKWNAWHNAQRLIAFQLARHLGTGEGARAVVLANEVFLAVQVLMKIRRVYVCSSRKTAEARVAEATSHLCALVGYKAGKS